MAVYHALTTDDLTILMTVTLRYEGVELFKIRRSIVIVSRRIISAARRHICSVYVSSCHVRRMS